MARQLGCIQWFGGYNSQTERENKFGFIARDGEKDLFVHLEQVRYSPTALREGTWVTFEEGEQHGKACAKNLKLLDDEDDMGILRHCFEHGTRSIQSRG